MSSYMKAGFPGSRAKLASYFKPNPRYGTQYMETKGPYERRCIQTALRRAQKTKKLGYTPTSKWDALTRPKKMLVKGLLEGAVTALAGGLLGGLLGKSKMNLKPVSRQDGSGHGRRRRGSRSSRGSRGRKRRRY